MHALHLRPATRDDLEFIFAVTESAMREYVVQIWGTWQPDRQRRNVAESFDARTHSIVLMDDAPAGTVAIERHATHIQLLKLYLLPEYRNHGIGAELLRRVLQEGRDAGKPVRLRVLAANTSAQRFYARRGFLVTGTTPERIFMEVAVA